MTAPSDETPYRDPRDALTQDLRDALTQDPRDPLTRDPDRSPGAAATIAPNPFAVGADAHAVWGAMLGVYAGFGAGDRAATDAHISPDATMFDSDVMPLIHGRAELEAIRDTRPPRSAADPVVVLQPRAPEVRVYGDTAVLLHLLAIDLGDGSPAQTVRNTSVWRRASGTWLMVHNHEDVIASTGPGSPERGMPARGQSS